VYICPCIQVVNIGLEPPLTFNVVQVKLNQVQRESSSTAPVQAVLLHSSLAVFCVSQELIIVLGIVQLVRVQALGVPILGVVRVIQSSVNAHDVLLRATDVVPM